MSEITIANVIDQFVTYLHLRNNLKQYSAGSIIREKKYLGPFKDKYGAMLVSEAKQHHFLAWIAENAERWKSDYSRRDGMAAIVACFRWAEDQELITRSPFRRPRGFRMHLKHNRKAFTRADYIALMWTCTPSNVDRPIRDDLPAHRTRRRLGSLALRQALAFLFHTGCRPCEMRALRWRDIDWITGVATLPMHKTYHQTGKPRMIGLDNRILAVLKGIYLKRKPAPEDFVFLSGLQCRTCRPCNIKHPWGKDAFARHFRRWADKAGIDRELCPYSVRHGFAVDAIVADVGERQLANQMGHADTRMISHYSFSSRQNASHLRKIAGLVRPGHGELGNLPAPPTGEPIVRRLRAIVDGPGDMERRAEK